MQPQNPTQIVLRIHKTGQFPDGFRFWHNAYLLDMPGGIWDPMLGDVVTEIWQFERRIHGQHVMMGRVLVHETPYNIDAGFRQFKFPYQEPGLYPLRAGSHLLSFHWGWLWKHEAITGRSGRAIYRGCLQSDDVHVNKRGDYSLRRYSPQNAHNVGGIWSHFAHNIWDVCRVGIKDKDFNIRDNPRRVTKWQQDAPQYHRAIGNNWKYLRSTCFRMISEANDVANMAWHSANAYKPLPYAISGGVVMAALRWTNQYTGAAGGWAETFTKNMTDTMAACGLDPEAENCCEWNITNFMWMMQLQELVKAGKAWEDGEGTPQKFLNREEAWGPEEEARDTGDIAASMARLADFCSYYLALRWKESSYKPDATDLILADIERRNRLSTPFLQT